MASQRIISYNVNGIRAALRKGLDTWLQSKDFDIVCFQELKAQPEQLDESIFTDMGYHCYWHSAEKKGYSGVAILSKIEPKKITYGMGNSKYDSEGRVLIAEYAKFTLISTYFPSGTTGDVRQTFKYEFLDDIYEYIIELKKKKKKIVLCGDLNIAHHPIDIHNPVSNKKSSGFLPEEREWLTKFYEEGFIDTFRHFHDAPHNYSWWSYRANARNNNKGWRIDYFAATENMKKQLVDADIFPDAKHSDHCPIYLEIEI